MRVVGSGERTSRKRTCNTSRAARDWTGATTDQDAECDGGTYEATKETSFLERSLVAAASEANDVERSASALRVRKSTAAHPTADAALNATKYDLDMLQSFKRLRSQAGT